MRGAWGRAFRVHERLRPLLSRQFAAFLLVGGTAAAAQWLSRFAFSHALPYAAAVVCAYAVGVLVAFELNRRFVFPTAPGDRRFVIETGLGKALLGDLPVLGYLFRSNERKDNKTELLVFITPRIINDQLGLR